VFVAGHLAAAGRQDVVEVASLLVSELVTNAIQHAGSEVNVHLEVTENLVRVEVDDASPRAPLRLVVPEDAERGRGLQLVEALAASWGVDQVPGDGKKVWFEV
jgi:two-component sensor histidine kinase